MTYEINFLVLQSKTEQLEKIRKEAKSFIESYGAKIVEEKEYLKRKLAYEIQHENYGFFTVLRFEFEKNISLDELKNKLNQKKEIARYIIVKADELPSLEEQDAKKMEKIYANKKSIKSKDVEKALKEQAKKKTSTPTPSTKKNDKVPTDKKEEETTSASSPVVSEKDQKEEKKTSSKSSTPTKVTGDKKTNQEKNGKDEVSLDELDKKLDEILNS